MSFAYIGSRTLGECIPSAIAAQAGLDASVALALPEISAKVAGALAVQALVTVTPPTIASQLEAALALVASLQVALPGASIDLAAMAAVIAELQVSLGAIQAQVAFSASLSLLFGAGGIYAYQWTGRAGDAVPGGLPGVSVDSDSLGIFLVTASPASFAPLQEVFGL